MEFLEYARHVSSILLIMLVVALHLFQFIIFIDSE